MKGEKEVYRDGDGRRRDVRRLMLTLACAAILMCGCLVLNGVTWERLQESSHQQSLVMERMAQTSVVLTVLQDIELGDRGYLISGNPNDLEVFDEARNKFTEEWVRLIEVEKQDEGGITHIEELRKASEELIQLAIKSVFVRQQEGYDEARTMFSEGAHRVAMAHVKQLVVDHMDSLSAKARSRRETTEKDFQAGLATSMAMGLLALGMGGISLFLLRRVLREMKRSERYAISMLRAEESKRQKDVFLAMMSHEIRTPLNAIIGFGQLAQQEELGDAAKRYVKSILEGGNALVVLINDILDLSKLEAGRMKLSPEPTDIRDLLGFMERLFQETCMAKGIRLIVSYDENLPKSLLLDAARLRQVLMNLIGNAVKFTEEGSVQVSITSERSTSDSNKWNIDIKVQDTGKGMAKEEVDHIFEAFFQTSGTSKANTQGTGLGLSIVKRFVELMGGQIRVKTGLDEGSTFHISLPDCAMSSRVARESLELVNEVDFDELERAVILAVDDHETNLELIREIFRGSSHVVITAKNGQEALEKIEAEKPNVVLMDLRMPVMDGPTAAARIKEMENLGNLPIIAITAGSLPGESERMAASSAFDTSLRKPFSRNELFETLSMFLEVRSEKLDSMPHPVSKVSSSLMKKLQVLLENEWVEIRGRMIVSEVVEFAQQLSVLADSEDAQSLAEYAGKLNEAAASYSFTRMETELAGFPSLVEELSVLEEDE
ncbi:ATP-binding protein [Luteolibacter algae]|uniref:histidine kinase n=1 Tax=Luteolibacter algae TaxID=454151 RepID=A0ABW5D7W6_9BACT